MGNLKLKIFKALMSAFPSRGKLSLLLGTRFGVDYDVLTHQDALDVEYWTVIEQVEAEGWLADLARAAYESVPRNPALGALVVEFGLTSVVGALPQAVQGGGVPPAAGGPALERMVRERSSLNDVPTFLGSLAGLEGRVCRIETTGLKARGTGFLVGPDLIMTNHHVVADSLPAKPGAGGLVCRFDYLVGSDGVEVRSGRTVGLAADWLVCAQPHDPSDVSLTANGPPAADALDFALLRLAEPVGDLPRKGDPAPDNPARGWIGVDRSLAAGEGDDIFILQHPDGAPLKLGVGRITALFAQGLRMRHDVTTEPGSSGSPVLDRALRLIGLHHVGDPNAFRNALWNQAVPVANIIAFLDGKVDPFWEVASN
jgi:hypothetical protein